MPLVFRPFQSQVSLFDVISYACNKTEAELTKDDCDFPVDWPAWLDNQSQTATANKQAAAMEARPPAAAVFKPSAMICIGRRFAEKDEQGGQRQEWGRATYSEVKQSDSYTGSGMRLAIVLSHVRLWDSYGSISRS